MSAEFFNDGESLSFGGFRPFRFRQLFFKGGSDPDTSVKDTEDQKELAKIANERFARYKQTFQPVENAYMAEIDQMNTEGHQQQGSNMAAVNTESAFAESLKDEVQGMTAYGGMNMNSGAVNQAVNDNSINRAEARGKNVTMTQQGIQDEYLRGVQGIVAMGNGQSTEAIRGMGEMSQYSADEARNDAVNSFNSQSASNEARGAVAGMAYSAFNNEREAVG